ncbi:hypothetical protein KORDIASMS9_01251 [Kordia sp. SMS9]|uniref:hypothetical protein n=1 Tax=Kordia sp. SMS9 TaxID=2282170 RepID=UPI000E106148|nr:hypothetical protein [Kordia sp. SMS9]AXG69032.1 hypothetical protein KORDIASMS9_01251 [Kordia sp. SMS9]
MKQNVLKFLTHFSIFTISLFAIHQVLHSWVLTEMAFFYNPWSIHLFLFLITFLLYVGVAYIKTIFKDKAALVFLGGSFLKMLAAILFLVPYFKNRDYFNIENILAFFIPYFLYLAFEAFYVLKLINQK